MRKRNGELMRQLAAAIFLSALAIAAMMGVIGSAGAADLLPQSTGGADLVSACPPQETVVLFEERFGLFDRMAPDRAGANALLHLRDGNGSRAGRHSPAAGILLRLICPDATATTGRPEGQCPQDRGA